MHHRSAVGNPRDSIRLAARTIASTCLEDGKRFKSLKRHLRTVYDLTPDQYRAKWGLAPDYPMVAPNYAAARSEMAKSMGLGARRRAVAEPQVAYERVQAEPEQAKAPARGRRKKAA